jgi:outer membrane lipoprotein-sorting protein
MRKNSALIVTVGIALISVLPVAADDVLAIVRRLDTNDVYKTLKAEAEFLIQFNGKKIVKRFAIQAKGDRNSFVEFTNPEDAGTKFLKKDGNLFLYSPDAEEIIPITGHMLKESMMGSDLSYEDTVGNDTLESLYDASISAEADLDGRAVWVLDFVGKKKTISYPRLKMWVDKETFISLKTERYALSGALLKEELVRETKEIGGRNFPVRVEVRDLLRKDSRTVFVLNKVELDAPIPDSVFSMRNLQR